MSGTTTRHSLLRWLAVLVVGIALAGCGSKPAPAATPTAASTIPFPEVPRISVEETAAHVAAGTALIVDVRGEQYYAEGHIPNSVSLPLTSIESNWNTLPQARLIITVCT